MRREVEQYVDTCLVCQQAKYSRQKTTGFVQPLGIPEQPWTELSMDFITQLPKTKGGHDAVTVFVERLTKMVPWQPPQLKSPQKEQQTFWSSTW